MHEVIDIIGTFGLIVVMDFPVVEEDHVLIVHFQFAILDRLNLVNLCSCSQVFDYQRKVPTHRLIKTQMQIIDFLSGVLVEFQAEDFF